VILSTGYISRVIGAEGSWVGHEELFKRAGVGLASGLASFLVLAILPVFERFGIITDMQLLELTGLHHPLLRRLEEEAPGTWQHTLNVAKLAEAAAVEIGVNYLLVRAGCYYHDIGKMAKPEYFTENQITPEDKQRHSELKPQMSALVIKNHVKEGIEMAKAANLPERIIDFIREHHGTSVIAYFYHKALEAQARGDSKELVRIEDYRYPYLKPQTIETAIVMLADAVEATATAKLSNRSVREDDIQQVVRTTIFEKFNDGQFNECNLTLRDLEVIRETFVRVLKSRFHTRIDYPKKPTAPSRTSASRELSKEDVLPKRRAESKDPV
jgi:putative nucleotidyltransferase with HDIG domain